MIIKIRRKAVISGRLPMLITEASTLMFQLRKCLIREGLAKLAERFGEEAGEE